MRRPFIAQEAATLSSGTMSTLTGYTHYLDLDAIRADFVRFCMDYTDERAPWQDAWDAYQHAEDTLLQQKRS